MGEGYMEREPSSQDENSEADELLRIARERVRPFYELLDKQAAASHRPSLIQQAIAEAMQRARPIETVELPDEEE